MNPYQLNARTIAYVEDFLTETIHLKNRISVKCYVVKMTYGSILKIKVYRRVKGQWERYCDHITRVKCETDLAILHGVFHQYQYSLQYMYEEMNLQHSNDSTDSTDSD